MRYERNDERKSRISTMLGVTAGIAAGAFMLKDSGNMKMLAKAFDDIGTTTSKIAKDVSLKTRKELDYDGISSIMKKHILNEDSTWKTARASNNITIAEDRGLIGSIFKYNSLKNDNNYIVEEMTDAAIQSDIFKKAHASLKGESKEFFQQLKVLMDESLDKRSSYFDNTSDGYKAVHDEFERRLDGSILADRKDEIINIMEEALNNSEAIRNKVQREYDSVLKTQITDEYKKYMLDEFSVEKSKDFFSSTLDRAATVNDFLTAVENKQVNITNGKIFNGKGHEEIYDMLKKLKDETPEFGDLVLDNATLRVSKDGELYSTNSFNKIRNVLEDEIADTIPGKLFGVRNKVEERRAPDFMYFAQGSYDALLANITGSENGLLKFDHFRIGKKTFQYSEGKFHHLEEADNFYLISGKHGSRNKQLNRMTGNIDTKEQNNALLRRLDINTVEGTKFEEIKGIFKKFEPNSNWDKNIVKRLLDPSIYGKELNTATAVKFHEDLTAINSMFNRKTMAPSNKSIAELKKYLSKDAEDLLSVLDADNPVEELLKSGANYKNKDLNTLLNKYSKYREDIPNYKQIGSLGNKRGVNVLDYNDLIKREVVKEAFLLDKTKGSYSVSYSKLSKLETSGAQKQNLRDLFNWTVLQEEGDFYASSAHKSSDLSSKLNRLNDANRIINGKSSKEQGSAFLKDFRSGLESFVERNSSALDSIADTDNTTLKAYKNNRYVNMRKAISPLDIINSINNDTKFKSNIKGFGKQFVAGRNSVEDITTATFMPYHLVNRLTTPLESLGLGFSKANTGSTLEMIKGLALKRILPIAAIIGTASYLDYEARNFTGTSLQGALYNSKARFELGIKTIDQVTTLDEKKERSRAYNPLAKYWFGEYKDKDEYLDYLENGYDPVRKGRYWSFGSASEFRGGKISYWEPNKLRQVHSNYKDIALYGSSEEKWKHSIIPTLRHPFSTIRYLANPYWLEEKHYWDRPYPVTAKMFAEGTPWGAVLNPTIGQIIKPQKKMHQREMQGTLTDVRSIISQRNQDIKDRAQENRLTRFDSSGYTPMAFAPESMPSLNEAVYTININNGRITEAGFAGQQYSENMGNISNTMIPVANTGSGGLIVSTAQYAASAATGGQTVDLATAMLTGLPGLFSSGAVSSETAISIISQANKNIRDGNGKSIEFNSAGAINEKGNLHAAVYQRATARAKREMLQNSMIENVGSKKEFVSDLVYSAKQISGMYGFLGDTILPASKGYKLENAGAMTSFSRSFWDQNIGGVGGDFMEIARRFFPHENHDIEAINTIKNTMPEWLPSRFWEGDPYTKVTKGEARLPGAGYEALNKLHSDQYGRYGAFDRYKILADVAPNSDEYKTWKKIAKEQVKDPKLKAEMEQIEKRVKEQTKEHDFYNYKFLSRHLTSRNAVIESVTNTGGIKVVGSDVEYQIAGIKPLKDEEGTSYIHKYLRPGMYVNLAFEDNKYRVQNADGKISAVVFSDGDNVSKLMYRDGAAKEKETKDTLADEYFNINKSDIAKGKFFEAIGHAQIPFIHNKFMRIDSPLESYRKEQVYGTPYSTWDHPIKGFVKPVFQEYWGRGPIAQAVGVGTAMLSMKALNSDWGKAAKIGSHALFAFTNPAGFAGGMIGALPRMSLGSSATRIGWSAANGAYLGAAVGLVGYGFANLDNPFLSTGNFAAAGMAIAKQLNYTTKAGKTIGGKEGALIGAAVGLSLSALKNPEFSLDKLTEKYIPKDTKKKWEIEEYFDRLEYMKYNNLYLKAAREAKRKEGVDVEKIINRFEYNRKKNEKIIKKLERTKRRTEKFILDENLKEQLNYSIDQKIYQLTEQEQYYNMGEYTKSAIAYKKAADTTIYGLSKYSSTADVLRALPKYDRDYFLEFANENDPKERKKILKHISPYKQKALKVLWGEELDKEESNINYFKSHNLPNMFWSGWRPDVDLDHVKMKTIENEGMLLSDFGMYESNKSEPAARMAPSIRNINQPSSPLALQRDLISLLNGAGLTGVDVSVEPSEESGLQLITNVTRVAGYNLQEKVNSIIYTIF